MMLIHNARIWRSGVNSPSRGREYSWMKFNLETGEVVECGMGEHKEASRGLEPSQIINMGGKWIFPGFHDAHAHVELQGRLSNPACDFTGCKGMKNFQNKLREKLSLPQNDRANGDWYMGYGWSQTLLDGYPTAQILDEVCDDRPMFIYRWCLHIAAVNTKALEICGISRDSKSPPGGAIDFYPEGHPRAGEPTGILREDPALELPLKFIKISMERRKENILNSLQTCVENGMTSIHCCDQESWAAFVELARENRLTIPCYFATFYSDFVSDEPNHPKFAGESHGEMLKSTAVKIFVDGALGSHTAALSLPYVKQSEGEKDNYGLLLQSQEKLNQMVKFADDRDYQLEIHVIGDAAVDSALQALETVQVSPDRRPIFVHCQVMRSEFLPRMKACGAIASVQPQFVFTDSPWAKKILPQKLQKLIYPWKTMRDFGVHCAGSTDIPANEPTPLMGVYDAIFQPDSIRDPKIPSFQPHECLSFTEAVDLMTTDAAYLDSAENRVGKLEPGFLANFIVLDVPTNNEGHIFDISKSPEILLQTKIGQTWVKGVRLFSRA